MPQTLVFQTGFESMRTIDFRQVLRKLERIAHPVPGEEGDRTEARKPTDVQPGQAPVGRKLRNTLDAELGGNSHLVAERLKLGGVNPAVAKAELVDQGRGKR